MLLGSEINDPHHQRLDQLHILLSERPQVAPVVFGDKYPGGKLEHVGTRLLDARPLLAGHGMSAEESRARSVAEDGSCAIGDVYFGAANIGKQSGWREQRANSFDEVNDAAHRRSEYNHIAPLAGARSIDIHRIDDAQLDSFLEDLRPVPANHSNTPPPERACERTTDQAGAKDRNL